MPTVFEKLNWKAGMPVLILNAPESLSLELATVSNVGQATPDGLKIQFVLAFVVTLQQVQQAIADLAGQLGDDPLLWFAYPKGSSQRYSSELSRDRGWQSLLDLGFGKVRIVAIDEDWSALRFRRADLIRRTLA